MEKNPFVKKSKYNPDVTLGFSKKINERSNTSFEKKNEYFNSQIQSVDKINDDSKNTSKNIDEPILDLEKQIQRKLEERKNQEYNFKDMKNVIPSSNPNEFKQFNDLKNNPNRDNEKLKTEKNNGNFTDVMDDLRNLGILS